MRGFFTPTEVKSTTRPEGRRLSCASCGLYKDVQSPRMSAFGNFGKGILNVGEGPGEQEDLKGRQWQGKVGQALEQMYNKFEIDLFEDCLNINAVNCRPTDKEGNNRKPTNEEIACCRSRVLREIEHNRPKVVMLFGDAAVNSVIGHRWKKGLGSISKWRGWTIPDRDLGCWVCPTYHPSYMERGDREVETIWKQDVKRALAMVDVPFPKFPDETKQIIIPNERDLPSIFRELEAGAFPPDPYIMSLDIETTGKKPHTDGHRIISWSFCNNPGRAYSFRHPKDIKVRHALTTLLKSRIGKVAQNMKFEHNWIYHFMGFDVQNWVWDTMLAAHALDNREGITSLKFQAYVNFGVVDYDSEVNSYLQGVDGKDANSKNKIEKLISAKHGEEQLLTYGGLDALFEYKLAVKQMKQLNV